MASTVLQESNNNEETLPFSDTPQDEKVMSNQNKISNIVGKNLVNFVIRKKKCLFL